jgi:hypothetical protein
MNRKAEEYITNRLKTESAQDILATAKQQVMRIFPYNEEEKMRWEFWVEVVNYFKNKI